MCNGLRDALTAAGVLATLIISREAKG